MNDIDFNQAMALLYRLQSELLSDPVQNYQGSCFLTRVILRITVACGACDGSAFHVNHHGFQLVLADGWCLYVVNNVDGLMYVHDAEHWEEWIRRIGTRIDELFLYSDRYTPRPLLGDDGTAITLESFIREVGTRFYQPCAC